MTQQAYEKKLTNQLMNEEARNKFSDDGPIPSESLEDKVVSSDGAIGEQATSMQASYGQELDQPAGDTTDRKQTQEEQLSYVLPNEEHGSDGEDCELHVYERRRDIRGEERYLRAGTNFEFEPPKRRSHKACLLLTRYFYSSGDRFIELVVQSRHIIKALREVGRQVG